MTSVISVLLLLLVVARAHAFVFPKPDPADRIDPVNPFPAGIPMPNNPFVVNAIDPWVEPKLPENAYRGVYVSGHTAHSTSMHRPVTYLGDMILMLHARTAALVEACCAKAATELHYFLSPVRAAQPQVTKLSCTLIMNAHAVHSWSVQISDMALT